MSSGASARTSTRGAIVFDEFSSRARVTATPVLGFDPYT